MTEEEIKQEQAAFEEWYNQNFREKKKFDYGSRELCVMFTSWLAAKKDADKQSAWIPVAEKYPEEQKQEVIVKLADGTVRIALYSRHTPSNQDDPLHYFEGDLEHVDGWRYHAINFENVEYWKPLQK